MTLSITNTGALAVGRLVGETTGSGTISGGLDPGELVLLVFAGNHAEGGSGDYEITADDLTFLGEATAIGRRNPPFSDPNRSLVAAYITPSESASIEVDPSYCSTTGLPANRQWALFSFRVENLLNGPFAVTTGKEDSTSDPTLFTWQSPTITAQLAYQAVTVHFGGTSSAAGLNTANGWTVAASVSTTVYTSCSVAVTDDPGPDTFTGPVWEARPRHVAVCFTLQPAPRRRGSYGLGIRL